MKVLSLLLILTLTIISITVAIRTATPSGVKGRSLQSSFQSTHHHLFLTPHPPMETFLTNASAPWGYINVMAYGAIPDGKTDNTAAFQRALHAGKGGKVFVPAGRYMLHGTLSLPSTTVLEGVNAYPFSSFQGGSVLLTTANANNASAAPFLWLNGPDAGIKGLTIVYPNQDANAATPTVYPPCIQGSGNDLSVVNVLLGNPYIGIDFATYSCPRHLIDNVYGQPIAIGIQIDQIYDIGRIRHCHFWPFYAPAGSNLDKWIHANGVTFLIKRSDWEVVEDVFSWGYHRGMVFDKSANGACNGQFTDIDFDDVDVGIDAKHSQPYGLMFSNLNLANAGNGPTKIAIRCGSGSGANTHLVVRGLVVWGQFQQAVSWDCGGKLTVTDSIINGWDSQYAALTAASGRIDFHGIYFHDLIGTAIDVQIGVDRALVFGNDLIGNKVLCNAQNAMCKDNLA